MVRIQRQNLAIIFLLLLGFNIAYFFNNNNTSQKGIGSSSFSPKNADFNAAALMFNTNQYGNYFNGYNIFVINQLNFNNYNQFTSEILITDMNGNIFRTINDVLPDNITDWPVRFINSTTILFGNASKVDLFNIYTNQTRIFDCTGTHDFEYNPINDTIFTFNSDYLNDSDTLWGYDMINEYNQQGDIVWSLNTTSFINPSRI